MPVETLEGGSNLKRMPARRYMLNTSIRRDIATIYLSCSLSVLYNVWVSIIFNGDEDLRDAVIWLSVHLTYLNPQNLGAFNLTRLLSG